MIALLTISLVAVIYAIIRGKHDSYLVHGPWKTYAFIEGVFIAICAALAAHWLFDLSWIRTVLLGPLFGCVFWIMFDGMSGVFRVGKFLYIGTKGFDALVNKVVKGRAWVYLVFKSWWLVLVSCIYIWSFPN